uniref:collagen alpha-1(VIII) chain-like n=1 Tax=Monopterus albus TaxID=43700 RepID=UPI0009B2F89B|nr:collagen alpha-1(VIII) chain-like [Monopterus albus]
MKITVVSLLLLVCSVSSEETTTKEQPQDIGAVVRELTAWLVQKEVEISSLQRENQEQAAKLANQEAEIEKLKQQLPFGSGFQQVAFSASLSAQGALTLGPFGTPTILIFKHVVTNIGNAYNPNTGVFTVPVRGVYHFEWHIGVIAEPSHGSDAVLIKNTVPTFNTYEYQMSGYGSSSQGVNLLLEPGDILFLRIWPGSKIYDNDVHQTTFSGHLLFTMNEGNNSSLSANV